MSVDFGELFLVLVLRKNTTEWLNADFEFYERSCEVAVYLTDYIIILILFKVERPDGAVVTRLTRNEKIIGSIPILGIASLFLTSYN